MLYYEYSGYVQNTFVGFSWKGKERKGEKRHMNTGKWEA